MTLLPAGHTTSIREIGLRYGRQRENQSFPLKICVGPPVHHGSLPCCGEGPRAAASWDPAESCIRHVGASMVGGLSFFCRPPTLSDVRRDSCGSQWSLLCTTSEPACLPDGLPCSNFRTTKRQRNKSLPPNSSWVALCHPCLVTAFFQTLIPQLLSQLCKV